MNVVYVTSDKFVPQVATCMCSLFENNEGVSVYILGYELMRENKEKLLALGGEYHQDVFVIDLENVSSQVGFEIKESECHPAVISRLLMDRYLPKDLDRVLYMDSDTLVIDSLKELWETDLGETVVGACIEPHYNKKKKEDLFGPDHAYINSGILLIDLKKWRQEDICRKALDFYKTNKEKIGVVEQDSTNGALRGKVRYLSPQFNYCSIYEIYNYRFLKKLMGTAPYYSKEVLDDAAKNPVIIHFAGNERPWRKGNRHKWKEEWKRYLSKTAWCDMPEEDGWTKYFVFFYTLNLFTKYTPGLRYWICNVIYAVMDKSKKK